jgi:hypothetical protein
MKKEPNLKCKGLKNKDLRLKKSQTRNARGSKINTSDEKRGNPEMQGAQK